MFEKYKFKLRTVPAQGTASTSGSDVKLRSTKGTKINADQADLFNATDSEAEVASKNQHDINLSLSKRTRNQSGPSCSDDDDCISGIDLDVDVSPKKTKVDEVSSQALLSFLRPNTNTTKVQKNTNIKKGVKKVYTQKFRDEWVAKFKWLKNVKPTTKYGECFCTVCGRSLQGGFTHLQRHENNPLHQKKIKAQAVTPTVQTQISTDKFTRYTKRTELKMIALIAEHNLPISLMDHLPDWLKSTCPDSEYIKNLKCARTKTSRIMKEVVVKENLIEISQIIQKRPFSLIIDETTDLSTEKSLVILVRYFDDNKVKDVFYGLIQLTSATAAVITDKIKNHFMCNKVLLKNMVGFCADNAAVMMGDKNGVQSLLKNDIPDLFVYGCSCHSLHLCCSEACKKLPRALEQFCRDVFNYFHNSTKRQSELKEFQEFVDCEPLKLLRPSQTRWLSLKQVIDRMLQRQQWQALTLYFEAETKLPTSKKKTHLHSADSIFNALKNPVYKVYFLFLRYILGIVVNMNLEFQSEKSKISSLYENIACKYKTILKSFIISEHVNEVPLETIDPCNGDFHKPLDLVYFGASVEEYLSENNNLSEDDIKSFKTNCVNFYVELCRQIKSRFPFEDGILKSLNILSPKIARSDDAPSILKILKYFPNLKTSVDIENLSSEWRSLADFDVVKNIDDFEEFWSTICKSKNALNDYMFPTLRNVMVHLLCLPHSSAAAERIFSQLTLIKTKQRNRLKIETCDSLLHTKYYVSRHSQGKKKCSSFEPNNSILKWNLDINYKTVVESPESESDDPGLFE